jgi:cation:H+ antiporter
MRSGILDIITSERVLNELAADLPGAGLVAVIGVCLIVLMKSADYAIDGAVRLASLTRLPRMLIGATLISLGTTMPEMVVSTMGAWMDNPGLALGNGIGSVICDTGLILGLTCALTSVPANRFLLNRTGRVQVGSATLLVAIALVPLVTTEEHPVLRQEVGFLFLILLIGYLCCSYRWAKQESAAKGAIENSGSASLGTSLGLVILGLAGVTLASRILLPCTAECAVRFGVPCDIIAVTMVAFGTSIPELMTAVSSIRKGHPEIMIGNIVGADVLNCLFVIGAAASVKPLPISPTFYTFHFPVMILILYSFRFFIFLNKDGIFKRWQGIWFLLIYVGYIAFLLDSRAL